jgi:murein DD-endopeptidase MepM/ murein hydrolase activator NlpD
MLWPQPSLNSPPCLAGYFKIRRRLAESNFMMNNLNKKWLVIFSFSALFLAAGCSRTAQVIQNTPTAYVSTSSNTLATPNPQPTPAPQIAAAAKLTMPIQSGLARVTKKPFGIYITPKTSPVQPEKFQGYHTGTDFETTPAEQTVDVPIYAACSGKLLMKKYAAGYGGVAVQSCILEGQNVTIIYGHLRLSSIMPNVNDSLSAGQQIAVLGTGYSQETDGERRHLHFGIHKGTAVNILGYVQKQSDLNNWLNAEQFLK